MRETNKTAVSPYLETFRKENQDHIDIRTRKRQKNTKQHNNKKHMDTGEAHRNKNNVSIANMKRVTVTDQFILEHQEEHKLTQILVN